MGNEGTGDELICPMGSQCRLVAKVVPEQHPPEWPMPGVKHNHLKLLTPLQPIAAADAKEKHIPWFQWFIPHWEESPRALSTWLKKSNERSSSNWYLIRDQFGSFIPASGWQMSSEQCSGHLWELYISAPACWPATQPYKHPLLLRGAHFLHTMLSK